VVRRQITQAWFLLGFIGAIVLATGLGLAYVLASTVTPPLRDLETVAEELEGETFRPGPAARSPGDGGFCGVVQQHGDRPGVEHHRPAGLRGQRLHQLRTR
jgi:hypothetical protein